MKYSIIILFFFLEISVIFSQNIHNISQISLGITGKYEVGFLRKYESDSTRKYPLYYNPENDTDTTLYDRPIVINIWYPSDKNVNDKIETYKKYLSFNPPNPTWNLFLNRLEKFNLKTIKENAFRYTILNDTIEEDALFKTLFSLPINAQENSEMLNKKFPLIIYHPGLGGSIEEQFILCESLASHGYFVISSAYQSSTGKIMHPDWDLERSEKDIDFLINYAKQNLPILNKNIHLLGFSFGAQSNFNILLNRNDIKSMVSLDSRLEYSFGYNPRGYKNLPKDLLKNKNKITEPILLFSNQDAPYTIIDSLIYSNRFYVLVKNYEHYDFTSTKQMSNKLIFEKKEDLSLRRKMDGYNVVNSIVISFFNYYSQNPPNSLFRFDVKNYNQDDFYFEFVGKTKTNSVYLSENKCYLRNIFKNIKNIKNIEQLRKRFQKEDVCFEENAINSFAYYLMAKEEYKLSIETLIWACELFPDSSNLYDSLGEAYYNAGDYDNSITNYKKSLELNPENKNAIEMINKIKI